MSLEFRAKGWAAGTDFGLNQQKDGKWNYGIESEREEGSSRKNPREPQHWPFAQRSSLKGGGKEVPERRRAARRGNWDQCFSRATMPRAGSLSISMRTTAFIDLEIIDWNHSPLRRLCRWREKRSSRGSPFWKMWPWGEERGWELGGEGRKEDCLKDGIDLSIFKKDLAEAGDKGGMRVHRVLSFLTY